jgi:anaerobic magnesium-protoporphyrin IX monomethyl ester cyclase
MTEVLFGQSYYLRFDPKLFAAMQPYPPLGTLYAASTLRERGYEVALFDAMLADSEDEWAAALDDCEPRFAVLYEDNFNYLSKMCLLRMREAALTMIGMAKARGCTVILCGADATDHAGFYLSHRADFVLLGEGEQTLAELVDHLTGRNETLPGSILGLARKEEAGPNLERDSSLPPVAQNDMPAIIQNPRRPDMRDLDQLPLPAWDLVDVPRYRRIWLERHGYFSMNMVTTRGCPFHCNWCAKPIWGQRYNSRSPEAVAAELRWLKKTYQPDHIWFVDDIFGLKPGWIDRFATAVEAEGARVPFKCLERVDLLLRPGEVEALRRAGAGIVWVGAESGSQKILDAMDKGTQVEQIYEARRSLGAAGIKVGFFIQFGYPGETREDIALTGRMIRECLPDDIGISVSYPMPGTKFHAAVSEQLGDKQNWTDSSDLAMLYRGSFTTAFYRQLHRVVHKEYRARLAFKRLNLSTLSRRAGLRSTAGAFRGWLTLPFERWRLERLARAPQTSFAPPPHLPPGAAALPTPQPGE